MSNNRKVLVLIEYGWLNGGENSLLAIVPQLQQNGWDLVFACPAETELSASLEQNHLRQVSWNVFDDHGARKSQAEIRQEICSLLERLQPAIVHCNSLSTGRLAGPVAAQLQIPSVGYLRDIIKLSKQAVADLNQLNQVIAVSSATRDFHVARGLNAEKVQVIYNGVDLERFSPRAATGYLNHELAIGDQAQLVLCIGQIGLRKGTDTVIRSFLNLRERFENLHLLLIGMRNSQKQESIEFENYCHQLGNKESESTTCVHWLGRRSDVDQIFNEAVLLLHGARQEPLGRVLLEASASGCPFVATDVGGTREIVRDCHPELLLCRVDSVTQMTSSAAAILDNENRSQSIREDLRRLAETAFCSERCADDLNMLYRQMLARVSN